MTSFVIYLLLLLSIHHLSFARLILASTHSETLIPGDFFILEYGTFQFQNVEKFEIQAYEHVRKTSIIRAFNEQYRVNSVNIERSLSRKGEGRYNK